MKNDPAPATAASDPEADCLVAKLIVQIDKGDTKSINALLDEGASVDGCFEADHAELDHAANPPLVGAALDGNINVVDLLIRRGADLDARGRVYRVAADDDSDFKILTIKGTRPLHAAVVAGDSLHVVRSLLRNGADPNAPDDNGDTPLLRAASSAEETKCTLEIAKELINGGADVGLVNKDGNCPLLLAAFEENVPMVEELLKAGGDCSVANKCGYTALVAAADLGNTELVRLLLSAAPTTLNRTYPMKPNSKEYGTVLYATAGYGHEGTVEFLLGAGAKQPTFSDKNKKALCPLGAAVYFDHPGVVAMLLRKKGLESIGGVSWIPEAMETAVRCRRTTILQMLVNVGGEDRARQYWARCYFKHRTMLHWAASVGNMATMSVLLAAGADETATAADTGLPPYDYIAPCSCSTHERDHADEAARCRMRSRGPAFRARSWAWPTTAVSKEAASADPADGGTTLVVWSARPAPKVPPSVGVRIYRPQPKTDYVRLLLAGARYGDSERKEPGSIRQCKEHVTRMVMGKSETKARRMVGWRGRRKGKKK